MSTIAEIEAAIEKLPMQQVHELAHWLQSLQISREQAITADSWLKSATGVASPGISTANLMALTRGER